MLHSSVPWWLLLPSATRRHWCSSTIACVYLCTRSFLGHRSFSKQCELCAAAADAIADCCHTPFVAFAKETVHTNETTTSNWAARERDSVIVDLPAGGANGEATDDDRVLVWALRAAENCCCFFLPVASSCVCMYSGRGDWNEPN